MSDAPFSDQFSDAFQRDLDHELLTGKDTASTDFYLVEVAISRPSAGTIVYAYSHGSHPHGAVALRSYTLGSAGTIFASDIGYRSMPTDPAGVVSYPPHISQSLMIDRRMNLSPNASSIAAAWGTVNLSNVNGDYDNVASTWNGDARALKVLRGVKTREAGGPSCRRTTTGTYIGPDGVMRTADPMVIRWDYTTGVALLLDEKAATNLLTYADPESEDWSQVGLTHEDAGVTGPDGVTDAARLIESTDNSEHYTEAASAASYTLPGSTDYTLSVYAKAASRQTISLQARGDTSILGGTVVLIVNLAVGLGRVAVGTPREFRIAPANGSGWRRIELTITTSPLGGAVGFRVAMTSNSGATNYRGDGISDVLIWGGQMERTKELTDGPSI